MGTRNVVSYGSSLTQVGNASWSALDSALEHEIWSAIRQKLAGRTLLVITHRLETIMSADQVICIGSGRVLDCGSPAELRSRSASALWKMQSDVGDDREAVAGG